MKDLELVVLVLGVEIEDAVDNGGEPDYPGVQLNIDSLCRTQLLVKVPSVRARFHGDLIEKFVSSLSIRGGRQGILYVPRREVE